MYQNTDVMIKDGDNNFVMYPLAVKARNFRNNHPKNAFVFAIFDCCRNDPRLREGNALIIEDVAKGDSDGDYKEYKAGNANLVIVSSCVPTKKTLPSDRFTFALFEFLEKEESKDTQQLVLPHALVLFNHLDKSDNVIRCSHVVLLNAVKKSEEFDFITMAIELL